ncbi:hypothetical protein KW795_02190 [Candidatus Microgenomates bacterium]|nr:hypothetical protein [Candidatus Microgenomates bacterium]
MIRQMYGRGEKSITLKPLNQDDLMQRYLSLFTNFVSYRDGEQVASEIKNSMSEFVGSKTQLANKVFGFVSMMDPELMGDFKQLVSNCDLEPLEAHLKFTTEVPKRIEG